MLVKLAAMFEKPIQKFISVYMLTVAFLCGVPIFVWVLMNTVVVIFKMGTYIHRVLIFYGCLLS